MYTGNAIRLVCQAMPTTMLNISRAKSGFGRNAGSSRITLSRMGPQKVMREIRVRPERRVFPHHLVADGTPEAPRPHAPVEVFQHRVILRLSLQRSDDATHQRESYDDRERIERRDAGQRPWNDQQP